MIVVADTHALIWWLETSARLSGAARDLLERSHQDADGGVLVSVASRIDLHYLVVKGTLTDSQARSAWAVTEDAEANVRAVPVTSAVAGRFGDLSRAMKDPCDRLIVATALTLDVPLVTVDRQMHALAADLGLVVRW